MKEIKIYEIPNIDFIERIDDPYIGMIFYVTDIDTYYSVKTLKEINGINMKGSKVVEYVIDDYAAFGTGSGGGSGLTATQLSNIAKIPAIKSTVDALPNNYASKNHNHSEYASSSHRHDASEIDNLPSGGGTGLTTEQAQQLQTAYEHSQTIHVSADDIPTKTSQLFNDNNFVTKSYVDSITVIPEGSLTMMDVIDGEVFSVLDSSPSEAYGSIVLSTSSLSFNENSSSSFTVKLSQAPTNNQTVSIKVNNSYCTVNPSSLTFTSSNYSTTQTVTVNGVHDSSNYTNKTSVITLSSTSVTNKTVNVTINNIDEQPSETVPVQGVTLNKPTHTMKVDETLQLTPVITPSNATNQEVTWETSNGNCTVVGGLVTATAEGECVITCKTVDGNKSDTCNVTVQAKDIVDAPSNELNPSIKNGLTHMYDFTKLTTLSTQSDDLIGNMNIVIPSEFAGDGYLIYKNKHMNCGSLLEDDFTSFLTIKYDTGNYTFYCGDKSLTNSGSKYGTVTQDFEKYALRENQYYVLCVKFDSLNKKMYSYVNGELISSQTSESIINDKNIYTSFFSNEGNGENYNLLVYNRQLEDSEIYAVSGELKKELDVSNVQNLSIKRSLKEYYNFNLTQGSEKSFNSLVGDNELLVTGDISGNNGLVLGTASQSLASKYNLPFNRRCTYFLNTTIPSIATKGNKVIEFDNVVLNLSKTSCSLKIGTNTSQSFTPIQNEKNIIAFTFDINSNQAKLYHNGVLKSTIDTSNYVMGMMRYYMLANDLIHHALVLFDDVLTDEEILTISNELRGV